MAKLLRGKPCGYRIKPSFTEGLVDLMDHRSMEHVICMFDSNKDIATDELYSKAFVDE